MPLLSTHDVGLVQLKFWLHQQKESWMLNVMKTNFKWSSFFFIYFFFIETDIQNRHSIIHTLTHTHLWIKTEIYYFVVTCLHGKKIKYRPKKIFKIIKPITCLIFSQTLQKTFKRVIPTESISSPYFEVVSGNFTSHCLNR